MVLIKVLKRKDASSVLVAILLAMIIQQPLVSLTSKLASIISGLHTNNQGYYFGPGGGWKDQYLFPIVWAILQIIVLEVLAWVYILANRPMRMHRKK
jgi:uncharacterized membrane protein